MFGLSTRCYVTISHPQSVDLVVVCRIAYIQNDRLGTDVRSASSDMDAVNRHADLRRPSFGIVLILVRYHVSLTTAFVPQLQS